MNLITALYHRLLGIRRVLIVGPSGAGKTYITEHVRTEHHQYAVDADALKGLCAWVDDAGNPVQFKKGAGQVWLKTHHFVWRLPYLRAYLKRHRVVYVFGLSKNVFDAAPFFDQVYYLHVSPSIVEERLKSEDRANPWGKYKFQREITLRSLRRLLAQAKQANATIIDIHSRNLSPDDIFAEIR